MGTDLFHFQILYSNFQQPYWFIGTIPVTSCLLSSFSGVSMAALRLHLSKIGSSSLSCVQSWEDWRAGRSLVYHSAAGMLTLHLRSFLSVCTLLITCWYTRFELGLRMTIFYQAVTINQGVSPILAYLVALMNGIGGLAGWQWIFIIFGE